MTTQMAKKPPVDDPTDGGQTTPPPPPSPPKLRLVPPINFTPNTSLPPDLALIPSTDLTILLSDSTILKRYRAGRYKQGTNTALRIGWTSELSSAVSHIGGKCSPRASTDTLVSLALHISALDMIEWASVQSLAFTKDRYTELIPTLSLTTIHLVSTLLGIGFRPIGHSRTIVIPHHTDDDLSRLSATTGIIKSTMATLCISHTLSCQPDKYLNKQTARSLSEAASEVKHWLRWKAKSSETAIEEFEGFGAEIETEGENEDV